MSSDVLAIFGITGALLNIVGFIPYVKDIFRHKTKPERVMWWIYSGLFTLLFAAQWSDGARWLLFVTGVYALTSTLIALLSVRYGYGSFHKRDVVSISIAVLGFIIWILTSLPIIAIIVVIIVDFAGFWLTLVKSWHAPHSETLISWVLAFIGAILSLFSIGSLKLSLIIYPAYAVAGEAVLIWLLMYRRTKILKDPVDF